MQFPRGQEPGFRQRLGVRCCQEALPPDRRSLQRAALSQLWVPRLTSHLFDLMPPHKRKAALEWPDAGLSSCSLTCRTNKKCLSAKLFPSGCA
jgi:hypothetical protein